MLFKLTSTDVQNTSLIDCASGSIAYRITTSTPAGRSRSLSASSFYSLASSSTLSRENITTPSQKTTILKNSRDHPIAEIRWADHTSSHIRIGDEVLAGTTEIFDASFIKVLPEETLLPTRMEYVWRMTPEELTLLDDDVDVVGRVHLDCLLIDGELVPSGKPGAGHNFFELDGIPLNELDEILVTFILISTLRERMYWITKYVYAHHAGSAMNSQRNPLHKLRREASRSFTSWKASLFRNRKQ
ncbi:hypothetical protein BDW22DRAFT_1325729 [Trametopsis cervina]|nr:hypothetical protein BDW22DRAFT_1325729 [Trametopsis cervina]